MFFEEHISLVRTFTSKLQDEESIALYDARLKFFFDRDANYLEEVISKQSLKYKETYNCYGLKSLYARRPGKKESKFVIYGAGLFGKETARTLGILDIEVSAYVDGDPEYPNENIEGVDKANEYELCNKYNDCVVIIATKRLYQLGIYYKLLGLGVKEDNIFMYPEGGLYFDYGNQYFDVEQVVPNASGEIFIDAGCFNGGSSIGAKAWAGERLKKVIAFEPDKNNLIACRSNLEKLGCEYELINAATWSCETELSFDVNVSAGYGSKVNNSGAVKVLANSIDNVLEGKPATYIKLDVEGSELETLKGAIKTITKYKPKLAISIYHKPEDILEIPAFLESLNLDYKYYIRQYQTRKCETTLYAI